MFGCNFNPAQRRWVLRIVVLMGIYALCSLLAAWGLLLWHLPAAIAWLPALFPAFPIAGAVVATGNYIHEERDEFQSAVLVQSLLGGIGGILVVATVWGFLENYSHVRHLDLLMVWPMYCIFVGLGYGLVSARYK